MNYSFTLVNLPESRPTAYKFNFVLRGWTGKDMKVSAFGYCKDHALQQVMTPFKGVVSFTREELDEDTQHWAYLYLPDYVKEGE